FTMLLHSRSPWAWRLLFCRCSAVGIIDGRRSSIQITKFTRKPKKMPADAAVTLAGRDSENHASVAEGNQVLAEQTRLLHANAPLSQLVALINAAILAFVQWAETPHFTIGAWLVCMGTVSLTRLWQGYAFRRAQPAPDPIERWRNAFLLGAFAS